MSKSLTNPRSIYARAWTRDSQTNNVYFSDALLIAVLSHTGAMSRGGKDGKIVRQLMQDQNLSE